MRITDKNDLIDLTDRFDKIRKFFSEHSSNTITAHIYDKGCVIPNFVLTTVMRNDSNQYITFVAFDLQHASDEMGEIFTEHCSMGNIGKNLRFVSPIVYSDISTAAPPQRNLLFPNTHTLAKLIKKYINNNTDELLWLMEAGTMYGCEISNTQLLKTDEFFTLWETYIASKNKALKS